MKWIIFSDIHGNADALRKLLEIEKRGNNTCFIFCGDICGYYYQIKECASLLESIDGLISVRGNHDQYYLDSYDNKILTDQLVNKYGSSYQEKLPGVFSCIKAMPTNIEITIGEKRVYVQHGTPDNLMEGRIYPDNALPILKENSIYISGHTHYQMVRRVGNSIWINPGSLGQPRDRKGFSYCVMDENLNMVFRTVPIDIKSLVREIRMRDSENKYLEEVLYRSL